MTKTKTSTTILAITVVIGLTLYAVVSTAQPTGPNSLNQESSERGNLSQTAKTNNAEAGNVSELTIDGTSITDAWQGYYGNITGAITLEDSSGNVFYNWSGLGSISGEVYASRNDSVDWNTINCSNSTEISNENSYLGKSANDPDSVNQTFSKTNDNSFFVGGTNISTGQCSSTNAYDNTGSNDANFENVLLADGSGNIVYTALIDENQDAFNQNQYDFELLVGENGNATNTGTTPYYFYIELS